MNETFLPLWRAQFRLRIKKNKNKINEKRLKKTKKQEK